LVTPKKFRRGEGQSILKGGGEIKQPERKSEDPSLRPPSRERLKNKLRLGGQEEFGGKEKFARVNGENENPTPHQCRELAHEFRDSKKIRKTRKLQLSRRDHS